MKLTPNAIQLYLTVCMLVLYASAELNGPVVQTKLGGLRGRHESVKGRETGVHAYLGVPFAKPPLGPLRLAPPQPAEGWEGVRDATQQPLMCVQDRQLSFDIASNLSMQVEIPEISEDCLYLNIHTPAKSTQNSKLPVMVWVHGGGFSMGSASFYDGSALAAYQDVVVVLIQYRVGILGFLSTGDKNVPGNFGLLDQVEALRWVQEHIHNFGGDPGSVTIFGESAGGVSVSLLILSPLSSGLFHGAIAESGTAAMGELFGTNPLAVAQMVANVSGCDSSSTEKITECVMKLTVADIVKLQKENMLMLGITVDGQFLPKSVREISQNHEMHKVPFMTGVNNHEGGRLLARMFAPPGWEDGMDQEQATPFLDIFYSDPKDKIKVGLVVDEYLGTPGDRIKTRDGFTELIGDLLFTIPAIKTANFHRDAGVPVYFYEFQESPTMLKKRRPSFVGSDHGDEIFFVLGCCFTENVIMNGSCTEEEQQLSKTMMKYWGNFAHTGSPNGAGLVEWPQYGAEGDYLAIGMEQVPGQHLKKDRFIFMTQTLPEKIRLHQEKMDIPKTGPVVQTKLGGLRGQYVSVKGRETGVHAYLGVPFAKPPLGPLRLAPPQPAEGWEGVRDATQQPLMCVQDRQLSFDIASNLSMQVEIPEISEDCLYLNIHTPAKSTQNSKLPVMLWIHGGGFAMGSASFYDGSALAAYQDVVVVLIQYRVGILGFLSTGDEHLPGNFGLLDQVEALRWVQEHIHNFGGDPGSVTIFGESAGGVSVSLLILSPLSAGLFHGAIAESGTAAGELFGNNPHAVAQMVANVSGCDSSSTEKITECVMKLTVADIVKLHKENMLILGVTVDGQFLPKSVREIFQNHEMHKVPFMTGVNNHEGGRLLARMFAPPGWEDGMDQEQATPFLDIFYSDPKDKIKVGLVVDEYLGTPGDRIKTRDGFTELIGDLLFTIPAIKTANFHRDAGVPVYFYEFQESPTMLKKRRPSFVGSDHGDEIFFVLGCCFTENVIMNGSCTEEEQQLSKTMMKYWGNFAHTGSPNGAGLVEWPQYGAEGDYLAIGMEQVPGQHLKKDRFIFMTQTLPEKIRLHQEKMDIPKTGPVVQTKLGGLRGQYVSVKGRETGVHAYLGVPFAKPPLGPLRLAPPQPAEGWEGVRDATQQPLMCPQNKQLLVDLITVFASLNVDIPDISEDCLYLNIYTPAKATQDAKFPVMFWIHGGGMTSGSASIYDGSALAAYQDVVVVLVQYRLGLLGFLSTGDEHVPGNFGLLDQVEALRWVQEHIHNFGGDPGSVTIFGESAGGVSVSLLLLSPLSNGLFHNAIAESGTAIMDQLFTNDPLPMAQMAANASGCDITSTEKIAECMRNIGTDAMLSLVQDQMMRFPVNVDGYFLTKAVDELLENHELLKIPFITGVNNDECGWLIPGFFAPPNWTEGIDREAIKTTLAMLLPLVKDEWTRELMADEYMGTSGDRVKNRDGFLELLGDLLFTIPAIKTANAHREASWCCATSAVRLGHMIARLEETGQLRPLSLDGFLWTALKVWGQLDNCMTNLTADITQHRDASEEDDAGASVYLYEYQHPPKFLKEKRPSFVKSDHGDEIFTVLGFCFTTTHVKLGSAMCSEEDEQMSITMMSYWGNFARTGSPNGDGLVQWPQYGAEGDYLAIGMEQVPGQHLKKDRFTFMTQTLPEKIRLHQEEMEHSEL